MMQINEIISKNKELGIKTKIFNEPNGILGYTEGENIYLNTYYKNDLELTNKHELLHLYEDSEQFKFIKKLIFNVLKDEEKQKLRNKYYLKYNLLYSKEEIQNGILDNEITIDIIINNGNFPINLDDYIDQAFETIVNKKESLNVKNNVKRYLSLNLSRNMKERFSSLSKWEQLFANEYYKGKEKPLGTNRTIQVKSDAFDAFEKLYYETIYSYFEIDYENNKYLERKLDDLILSYESRGKHNEANKLKENYKQSLKNLADEISQDLYNQFLDIRNLLKDSSYEYAFKYLILKEALSNTYRYEKGNKIVNKREPNKTILPLMLLNVFILEEIYNNINIIPSKYKSFSDLYFDSLTNFNKFLFNDNNSFSIESSNDKGFWIKFASLANDPDNFNKNVKNLRSFIANTPWCTKKDTEKALATGDFYVFVDNYGKPHLAVKMIGDKMIDEIRGISNSNAQEIEEEYRQIAIDFLSKNKSVNANDWLQKELRNNRLIDYVEKIKNNTLTDEDITSLTIDLNVTENYLHYGIANSNETALIDLLYKNPQILDKIEKVNKGGEGLKLNNIINEYKCNYKMLDYIDKVKNNKLSITDLQQLYDDLKFKTPTLNEHKEKLISLLNSQNNLLKTEIAKYFGCNESEVFFGYVDEYNLNGNKKFPYKVVIGSINLMGQKDLDMSNLIFVSESVNLNQATITNISNLRCVGGNLSVAICNGIFTNLKVVNGNVLAFYSYTNFPSLEKVDGCVNIENSFIKELNSIIYIGKDLVINCNELEEMNSLEYVGKCIDVNVSSIKNLPQLKSFKNIAIKGQSTLIDFLQKTFSYNEKDQQYTRRNIIKK